MGGGSGALKFWKWVLAAFYQKLPTPKKRFYKSCHKMFLCSGEHNYLSFEIDAKQNAIQNWWFQPAFRSWRDAQKCFWSSKSQKIANYFTGSVFGVKNDGGSVMGPATAATVLQRRSPDENWWPLISSLPPNSSPTSPLLSRIVPKKPTYWAQPSEDSRMES